MPNLRTVRLLHLECALKRERNDCNLDSSSERVEPRIASGTGPKAVRWVGRLNPKTRHSNEPPAAVFECDDLLTSSDGLLISFARSERVGSVLR